MTHLTHEQFKAIAPDLTQKLAAAFEAKLIAMGDDIKGITWFCSTAHQHPKNA